MHTGLGDLSPGRGELVGEGIVPFSLLVLAIEVGIGAGAAAAGCTGNW